MDFQDRPLQCLDCKNEFIFTAGEQEFYERKGFKEIPKRCKPCRDARKTRRGDSGANASGGGYGNGNGGGGHGNGGGGGYGRGGNGHGNGGGGYGHGNGGDGDSYGNGGGYNAGGGGYSGGGGYNGGGGGGYSGGGEPNGNRAPRGGGGGYNAAGGGDRDREMFDATCAACGAPARVPFRPAAGRPVYCRDCYTSRQGQGSGYGGGY